MDGTIMLRSGRASCGIAPSMGCALTCFRAPAADGATYDWVRPFRAVPGDPVPSAQAGCFPLFPYSGRIAHGVLSWRGHRHRLPTGLLGDAHALHGTGWVRAWEVRRRAQDRAAFVLDHDGEGWPFAFRASLAFDLSETALSVDLGIENTGSDESPVGLGLHPIFSGTGIGLRANAGTVWAIDDAKLFAGTSPVGGAWDFRRGAPLTNTGLEHGFSNWDGRFELLWPDRPSTLVVTATEPLRHLVVYTRAYRGEDGFVCVEPVSHAVDAFNLDGMGVADTGTRTLAPGGVLSANVIFALHPRGSRVNWDLRGELDR